MRVAVASGKGGTGKTLVSTSLSWLLAAAGLRVTCLDADVEAPNDHLYLHPSEGGQWRHRELIPAPVTPCSGCGACQEFCAYNAIITTGNGVLVFSELCHSCGGCLLVCEEQALVEGRREIGTMTTGRAVLESGTVACARGTLDVGEAQATPLIKALQERPRHDDVVIVDAPPGTACAAMAAVRPADRVVMVVEPTPFGMHDLDLGLQMVQHLGKPVVAVINRADMGDGKARAWLEQQQVPVLAEIPFLEDVAEACAVGRVAAELSPRLRETMEPVVRYLVEAAR